MSKCEICLKKVCKCEEKGRKIINKLRGSTVVETSIRDSSLLLCLFSLKKGEYYVELSPTKKEIAKVLTKEEYNSGKRTIMPDMLGRDIDEAFYYKKEYFFDLLLQRTQKCFRFKDNLSEITSEEYNTFWMESRITDASF